MSAKLKVIYFGSDVLSLSLRALLGRPDVHVEAVFTSSGAGTALVRSLSAKTTLVTARVDPDRHGALLGRADAIISAGYSWKIPAVDVPYAVNLHPALLPACRGPTSVLWTLFDHPETAGVTLHRMTDVFDDGPILLRHKVDNAASLSFYAYVMICSQLGAALIGAFCDNPREIYERATPQDQSQASVMPRFPEARRHVSTTMTGERFIQTIRRLGPYGATFEHGARKLKIVGGEFVPGGFARPHLPIESNSVYTSIKCQDGFIILREGDFVIVQ